MEEVGNTQDILLKNFTDYIYAGELELTPYKNCTITILIENITGRQVTKTLNVMFVR